MILVIDAVNKPKFAHVLDEMFRLRARVFGDRLGWQVEVVDGRERDVFDDLDPAYAVGLDEEGHVVSCVRALQTTGPHMLSDVFFDILDGEPPLRSASLWESTRFCVDTQRLGRGRGRNSVSYATCELMIASLEAAKRAGVSDIVTVIDPVMDRVLKRSGNAPYDYVGRQADMGKVPALAALLDCTDERIERIRAFSGIETDVFIPDEAALLLPAIAGAGTRKTPLEDYCDEQIATACNARERIDAMRLKAALADRVRSHSDISA
ncbi:acyl-homoserine-lactone synthase [Roseovarius autotrophicus]|uniref:acyl-homoserine-lactone synthase n=1 Tax=Roseovarius autotrophicus TaxID=2824121 RepID=UPI0019D883CB|nr:acyl-homoserine-lactone synthase [Roseovarius autotrophicus]MBE0452106.1 autoinducer synthase [Roseovarius sp.]